MTFFLTIIARRKPPHPLGCFRTLRPCTRRRTTLKWLLGTYGWLRLLYIFLRKIWRFYDTTTLSFWQEIFLVSKSVRVRQNSGFFKSFKIFVFLMRSQILMYTLFKLFYKNELTQIVIWIWNFLRSKPLIKSSFSRANSTYVWFSNILYFLNLCLYASGTNWYAFKIASLTLS